MSATKKDWKKFQVWWAKNYGHSTYGLNVARQAWIEGQACMRLEQTAEPTKDRDALMEALRAKLVKLPRYSFMYGANGLRRVVDPSGNWIEFDQAHALFDAVVWDEATNSSTRLTGDAFVKAHLSIELDDTNPENWSDEKLQQRRDAALTAGNRAYRKEPNGEEYKNQLGLVRLYNIELQRRAE